MKIAKAIILMTSAAGAGAAVYQPAEPDLTDIPNRIPEAAPYVLAEAQAFPPPFEEYWRGQAHPGQCKQCHQKIFDEWNGSMMSNAWRDPIWRGAFLLLSREVSTHGECDTPNPPDGTAKAKHNPFAKPGTCSSEFNIGTSMYTVSRPGSLVDTLCSRCHMPSNFTDNFPLKDVTVDPKTGIESAKADPNFNPTSDNGTGFAFATLDAQFRNTDSGKSGVFCAVCHSMGATRDTPFHNYARSGTDYYPAVGDGPRSELLPPDEQDMFHVADPTKRNLGYSIGTGAYRLSPHAIGFPERFGPLVAHLPADPVDKNTSGVFGDDIPYQAMDPGKHKGFHQTMFVRAEMCATCHDVTNFMPIKNKLGKWAGGFPIERTYTEWSNSRYADRPGNANFDPHYKRDCQSCHMQQDYGQPGTAQTLYQNGHPLPPPMEPVAQDGKAHPFFTHHFVGGNTLVPRLVGKDVDNAGNPAPYPELSTMSYSSEDPKSIYSRAVWTHLERKGAYAQQARMAWDRLRHVLAMDLMTAPSAKAGASLPIIVTVANTGSGHDFPTGFPEARNAWLAVHAYDLATGQELPIHDAFWNRDSVGVGDLTRDAMVDPNFPKCNWTIPAGSADPYAMQFKAVASLGDGCPTLDLPYATPMNLATDANGIPVDVNGKALSKTDPNWLPLFKDLNGNGDLFDDSFLRDTRFKPMPLPEATKRVDRYSVVVPAGTAGPIAVSTTVYYQSVEANVALTVLGNLADSNNNFVMEPCVLGGRCDGRKPATEPPVVEGAPPVPMIVRNATIPLEGSAPDTTVPRLRVYPPPGADRVYHDAVVKVFFSKPVSGVDPESFTLVDSKARPVHGRVDAVGDAAWGLFPEDIVLKPGETYTAQIKAGICDAMKNCTPRDFAWSFTIAAEGAAGAGDTSLPAGFTESEQKPSGAFTSW